MVTAVFLSGSPAYLSVVESGRVDLHEYFAGLERRDGPLHDAHVIMCRLTQKPWLVL